MTWAQLIREYYKLCIESGCALNLSLDDLEPGAHYISITAHQNNKYYKQIIGYIGLGGSDVEGRMLSYDNYKDPDTVIEYNIKQMIDLVQENKINDRKSFNG